MNAGKVSALAIALTLGACGGGDSAPPTGGTPTPTPTATATPTPTPTPTPSYPTFAELAGDREFKTACGGLYGSSERIDALGFGRLASVATNLSINYTEADESWQTIGRDYFGANFDFTFTPAMLQANPPANTVYYRKDNADGTTERFYLGSRPLGSSPPDYLRTSLLTYRIGTGAPEFRYCVFGVPTQLTDPLPASTITFANAAIGGTGFVNATTSIAQYDLGESTVTVSADPATGEIPVILRLVGRQFTPSGLSDTRTPLGEYRGTAIVDPSVQSYNDAFTDADRVLLGGNFAGWFFGPQGAEIGFAYSIKAQNQDGSTITAAGTVTARR